MGNETKELFRDEVERQLKAIEPLPIGDQFMGGAIEDVSTLGRLLVEMDRVDAEIEDKRRRQELEEAKFEADMAERDRRIRLDEEKFDLENAKFEYELHQEIEQKRFQWIRLALDIGIGIAMPIVSFTVYSKWIKQGFEFEKEGTIVSNTFRNSFSKFRSPIKK